MNTQKNNIMKNSLALLVKESDSGGLMGSVVICGHILEDGPQATFRYGRGRRLSLPRNWRAKVISTPREQRDMFCGCSKCIVMEEGQLSSDLSIEGLRRSRTSFQCV